MFGLSNIKTLDGSCLDFSDCNGLSYKTLVCVCLCAVLLIIHRDVLLCSQAALSQEHTPQLVSTTRTGGVAEGGDTHTGTT